mmetsp:Transcript_19721/g.27721  ORF Transcript_19721/g.27721 Transcript_19721/m.27721 type:complete len:656 (+) Transcript_19721:30-1997(+)
MIKPPSQSYNLVLDTDSEDEDEDLVCKNDFLHSLMTRQQIHGIQRENYLSSAKTANDFRNECMISPIQSGLSISKESPSKFASSVNEKVDTPNSDTMLVDNDNYNNEGENDDMNSLRPSTIMSGSYDLVPVDLADGKDAKELVSSKKKKKKKKSKKKKSKRKIGNHADGDLGTKERREDISKQILDSAVKVEKKLSFGCITVREYERCLGLDGVPNHGGWPLGLKVNELNLCNDDQNGSKSKLVPVDEYFLDLDTFETRKQLELAERYTEYVKLQRVKYWKYHTEHHGILSNNHRQNGRNHSRAHGSRNKRSSSYTEKVDKAALAEAKARLESVPVYIPDNQYWETRQFDFKRKTSVRPNIFEKYAKHLGDKHQSFQDTNDKIKDEWQELKDSGKNVLFHPLEEEDRRKILLHHLNVNKLCQQDCKDLYSANDSIKSKTQSSEWGQRGGNNKSLRMLPRSRSNSMSSEHSTKTIEDGPYSKSEINHVRNELEQIRIHRSTDGGNLGCSCRKLNVPLFNSDANGDAKARGKKSHHGRFTERRVRDELRRRGVDLSFPTIKIKSRSELEQHLHDLVQEQGCCFGNDCPCVRNSITCQADACNCWIKSDLSHQRFTQNVDGSLSDGVEEIQTQCGNLNGMYVVDFKKISENREKILHP